MRYILKNPNINQDFWTNKFRVGVSYSGNEQMYHDGTRIMTVAEFHLKYPGNFDLSDTLSIKTQIVVNLSAQYIDLQKHYGFDETGMAEKISEIAEKICSKI